MSETTIILIAAGCTLVSIIGLARYALRRQAARQSAYIRFTAELPTWSRLYRELLAAAHAKPRPLPRSQGGHRPWEGPQGPRRGDDGQQRDSASRR